MDGLTDGGWMDGWMDCWIAGRMDGWMVVCIDKSGQLWAFVNIVR